MKGITAARLRQKFEGSVVLYEGKPVYVVEVNGLMKVGFNYLSDGKAGSADYSDKFSAPCTRLGMVNHNDRVYYVERLPIRRYRLGLAKENLSITSVNKAGHAYGVNLLASPGLANTILGKFPSFEEACCTVQQFGGEVAFDRQFAVDSTGYIHYKTRKVGIVRKGKIVFGKGWEYLNSLVKA